MSQVIFLEKDGKIKTSLRGKDILSNPLLNKGVAFTNKEREELGLSGILPPGVLTIEDQVKRAYEQFTSRSTDLQKNNSLNDLFNRNVVLYYRLLTDHLSEMLPIVYTPTVGQSIQEYSHEYHRPGGVYLSINALDGIEKALVNTGANTDDIDLIVATDSESILGIGDWGIGGINIAIGKLAVYTAAAGIHPKRVLPVVLDAGTNNEKLLSDPLYIGNRFNRIRGERYHQFIDTYIEKALKVFPNALLHWEDFGNVNARHIMEKYKDKILTFNDDIQGTGAVTLAGILSALKIKNESLTEQRILVFGPGAAGIGNADQIRDAMVLEGISKEAAEAKFWAVDHRGLLLDTMEGVLNFQLPYVRKAEEVKNWDTDNNGVISLLETVKRVKPTILIGTSGVSGAFSEEIIKEMAKHVDRPIIMPMSNPTALAEAIPEDLIKWTDGKALIATGSPFKPVEYQGISYEIGQSNNAFVFPGLGLGSIVVKAKVITDSMFIASAKAVAKMCDTSQEGSSLLPKVSELRSVSFEVAVAVAKAAIQDGVAQMEPDNIEEAIKKAMWYPVYKTIEAN